MTNEQIRARLAVNRNLIRICGLIAAISIFLVFYTASKAHLTPYFGIMCMLSIAALAYLFWHSSGLIKQMK